MRHTTFICIIICTLFSLTMLAACAPATPSPSPTPAATMTSAPTLTPTATPEKIFAPYIDVSAGASAPLMQLVKNGAGNKHYTLAFMLGRECTAAWSGIYKLDAYGARSIGARIHELRVAGGDVIIAFGGASGPELATTCSDASALQAQYQAVVTEYNLKTIDLDIEAFEPNSIDLRNKALTGLATANPMLKIQYTLGVTENGLGPNQLKIIENAKANGTRIDRVNIMTMDYGHPVENMYAAAVSAAQGTRKQLDSFGYTSTELGLTPMIGVNDSAGETFTLENATALVIWATANGITELSFWSISRDNGTCPDRPTAASNCSGIAQSPFQFSSIFQGFAP